MSDGLPPVPKDLPLRRAPGCIGKALMICGGLLVLVSGACTAFGISVGIAEAAMVFGGPLIIVGGLIIWGGSRLDM
jgi:hypothetical protein